MENDKDFDVIIIGGSYAGLSAAMALGRSLKRVLIIDSGIPCNRQTPHSHNFITQDGEKPSAIAEKARTQVLKYNTVNIINGLAVRGNKTQNGFMISTQNNENFTGKKLIFATGIKDSMPDIKGFAACWGISVVHCPYCHGYEIRDQKTAILANGDKGFHIASLVNNLTDNITVLTQGKVDFTDEQLRKLGAHNIRIDKRIISEIEHENGYVKNVIFRDGNKEDFKAVYAAIPFVQQTDIPVQLGCEITELGYIRVNEFQQTNMEGIYACGDNSVMMRSVANAVYSGNLAGAMVNAAITREEF